MNSHTLSKMSDGELEAMREAIDNELNKREMGFYEQVMEDPEAYRERVTNDTPFDSDDDLKDHLNAQAAKDPSFWDRQSDRNDW